MVVYAPPEDSPLSSVILSAAGPIVAALEAGNYVADLEGLGEHLLEDVLDARGPGLWLLHGRILATWHEDEDGGEWFTFEAETPWRAERVGRAVLKALAEGKLP